MIAPRVDPTAENHGLSDMTFTQFAAGSRPSQGGHTGFLSMLKADDSTILIHRIILRFGCQWRLIEKNRVATLSNRELSNAKKLLEMVNGPLYFLCIMGRSN